MKVCSLAVLPRPLAGGTPTSGALPAPRAPVGVDNKAALGGWYQQGVLVPQRSVTPEWSLI